MNLNTTRALRSLTPLALLGALSTPAMAIQVTETLGEEVPCAASA